MISDQQAGPAAEYTRRLTARRVVAARLAQLERRISISRLAVFIAGGVLAFVALDRHAISPWWIAVPVACFVALVLAHDRVINQRRRFDRSVAFYERGLARLEHRWAGTGEGGERFLDAAHPYAADLDLFGRGSLFELLCTARTRAGEDTLASWLRAPAPADDVRARQAAVTELRPLLDLREELALLGADVRAGLDPDALATWAAAAPVRTPATLRVSAAVLVALLGLTAGSWFADLTGPLPIVVVLAVQIVFAVRVRDRVVGVLHTIQRPGRDLRLLAELLARLEAQRFTSPRLVHLRAALDTQGEPPSVRIARLHRLIHLLDARQNQFFAGLATLLLWTTQLALAIDAWHATSGASVLRWLATVGEIEALCALAGYAYEHPDDPFPEIVERSPTFDSEGLGHPLIPEERCIRNDVRLGSELRCACGRQRLEHVGQEHAPAHRRDQRGPRSRRRAPVRARRLRLAVGGGRFDPHQRLAAGRHVALLRRDHAPAAADGPRLRPAAAAVPARRDPARHQLARPRHRRRSGRARVHRSAAPSAWSPRTTWRSRGLPKASFRKPPTSTSRITSRTVRWSSTTGCGPAWWRRATPWP